MEDRGWKDAPWDMVRRAHEKSCSECAILGYCTAETQRRGHTYSRWLTERGVPSIRQQWIEMHYGKQNDQFDPATVNLTGTA
jgi:hypothetical protein